MTLIEITPMWANKGIFNNIQSWCPWKDDSSINPVALNLDYYGNYGGGKECSPLVRKLVQFNECHALTDIDMSQLDMIIQSKYKLNWDRLWYAIQKEYEPLENYNSIEVYTPEVTTTQKYNTDRTDTTKEKQKTNVDNTTTNKVKGVGANAFSEVAQNILDGETTKANTDNEVETHTQGDKDDNFTLTEHEGKDTTVKSGNIGVTTSQQMLESEYELRKRNFFNYIYECIDDVLTTDYWKRRSLL